MNAYLFADWFFLFDTNNTRTRLQPAGDPFFILLDTETHTRIFIVTNVLYWYRFLGKCKIKKKRIQF